MDYDIAQTDMRCVDCGRDIPKGARIYTGDKCYSCHEDAELDVVDPNYEDDAGFAEVGEE